MPKYHFHVLLTQWLMPKPYYEYRGPHADGEYSWSLIKRKSHFPIEFAAERSVKSMKGSWGLSFFLWLLRLANWCLNCPCLWINLENVKINFVGFKYGWSCEELKLHRREPNPHPSELGFLYPLQYVKADNSKWMNNKDIDIHVQRVRYIKGYTMGC